MDASCLDHLLTDEENRLFQEDGYFVVHNVLPPELVSALIPIVDRLDAAPRLARTARRRALSLPRADVVRALSRRIPHRTARLGGWDELGDGLDGARSRLAAAAVSAA